MPWQIILSNIRWNLDDENLTDAYLIGDENLSREQKTINLENKLRERLILIANQRTKLINIKLWVGVGRGSVGRYMTLSYHPEQINTVGDLFGLSTWLLIACDQSL